MESIADIEKKVEKFKKVEMRIRQLEMLSLETSISSKDREVIKSEVEKLKINILTGEEVSEEELTSNLCEYELDVSKLIELKIEYIIPKFIIMSEITMIVAAPGVGKTSLAIAIGVWHLQNNRKNNLIYLDADNSLVTAAENGIHKLKSKFGKNFQYIHSAGVSKIRIMHILLMISRTPLLSNYLIVIDSAKNLMGNGKDRDNNKDVSEFMSILKSIRNQGATIIILHHVNKPQRDMEQIFAGAAAWMEDVSSAFSLKKNEYKKAFILLPLKQRVGSLFKVAYSYSKEDNSITECDLFYAEETAECEDIRHEIYNFIKIAKVKPTYSEILIHCTDICGFSKNKVNAVIQAAKEHYWRAIKEKENHNRDVFVLLDRSDMSDKLLKGTS